MTHVISGGMGERARGALGSIENVVDRFLKGELKPAEAPCCGDNLCGKK